MPVMLDLLAQVEPMSLPLWAVLAFSVAMYPLGFLFGVCSACCDECSNTTCDGFDLEEAFQKDGPAEEGYKSGRCFHGGLGAGYFGSSTTYSAAYGQVPDLDIVASCPGEPDVPSGCEGNGWGRRRSCVRWLCRCYESTGERSLENPAVSEWYTVVSTTAVAGGPTTNDLDLSQELENSTVGDPAESLEDYVIENTALGDFTSSPAGTRFCMIWAFVFYGWVIDCEEPHTGIPDQHESRDDCFSIHPCARCV